MSSEVCYLTTLKERYSRALGILEEIEAEIGVYCHISCRECKYYEPCREYSDKLHLVKDTVNEILNLVKARLDKLIASSDG